MMKRRLFAKTLSAACLLVGLGSASPLFATHKPAYRFIPPAEAVKLYWSDALNQFKEVRSASPHDTEPNGLYSTVRYDLVVAPKGMPVDDFDHPLVVEKRGKSELRNGQPQMNVGLTVARLPQRAAAEKLFKELKAVVQAFPGTQPRGEPEPFWVSVGVKKRSSRRVIVLSLGDEPEDGAYVIFLNVGFNEDDPSWD